MAAAWFNQFADPAKAVGVSAGTQPADHPHPEVVKVLAEVGIDISGVEPRLLDASLAAQTSWLVTMGCGETCPVVPGAQVNDWPIEDPKAKPIERVREIRDDIRLRVQDFVEANSWA